MAHPITSPTILEVTIASGESLSAAVHCGIMEVKGFYLPTIDSAKLTFQASADGVNYYEMNDATNSVIDEPTTTGDIYLAAPSGMEGANYLKVRTGTSGTAVTQSAERTIHVVLK